MDKEKIIAAGKIASEIKSWIKPQIKKGNKLVEIAEKIESRIIEKGGFPAFPVNLSINEYAAHYTPTTNDETLAHGLLKIDFGIHIDGWIADTAFTLDLEGTEINKKLIKAAEAALQAVEDQLNADTELGEIGYIVENTITSHGFRPIANLSGHSLDQHDLHSGATIPNVANNSDYIFGEGLFAIEPFATNGNGSVHDGPKGNIYLLQSDKLPRSPIARKVLKHIKDNFGTLPFAERWITKQFGRAAKLGLMQLEREGMLHHYPILTEAKGTLVSQAENTFLIEKEQIIVTTKE